MCLMQNNFVFPQSLCATPEMDKIIFCTYLVIFTCIVTIYLLTICCFVIDLFYVF